MRATQDLGVRERPGKSRNSAEISKYFVDAGHSWVGNDETPWCAAAMSAWCRSVGMPATYSLRARSWLSVAGNLRYAAVKVPSPQLLQVGDIVVLWRTSPTSPTAHVGLFAAMRRGRIWLLGGNQDNRVKIKSYPVKRFISGRRFIEK